VENHDEVWPSVYVLTILNINNKTWARVEAINIAKQENLHIKYYQ